MAFILYHGAAWKAESESIAWLKDCAMTFHASHIARDVFILPRGLGDA